MALTKPGTNMLNLDSLIRFRATDTTGGVAIGTSAGIFKFQTVTYDPSSRYSTTSGLFTVSEAGLYTVKASLTFTGTSLSTSQGFTLQLFRGVGGGTPALYSYLANQGGNGSGTGTVYMCSGADDIYCAVGDTIGIYAAASLAGFSFTAAGFNHVAIFKAGS